MQISIVIPTYNQGQYIRDCLASIQKQTYTNLHIIIQDSLSSDETESVCREFVSQDSRFHYFREKDAGQSDAINRGLHRSKGEVWTWICSDDYYSEHTAIETLMTAFDGALKADPTFVGVFGKAEYVSEEGKFLGPYHQRQEVLKKDDFKMDWPLSQPSSFLVTKKVVEVGGVDVGLHLGMDLDLFLKLLNKDAKLLYVDQLVASVRVQSNSKSVKYRKSTAATALEIIHRHFGDKGNPFVSAYAREFSLAQKEEWKEVALRYCDKVLPRMRERIKSYKARNSFVAGTDQEISQKAFSYRLVRKSYRLFKAIFRVIVWPVRNLMEAALRMKHASLPTDRKKMK